MLESAIETSLTRDPVTTKIYGGVIARDELPKEVAYPSCLVLNTKPREHRGEHWLAIYYDSKGEGDFFDSYGNHPSYFGLETFLNKTSTSWSYNKKAIQGLSSYCGYYCLLYLLMRSRNESHKFFQYFGKDSMLNDRKVRFNIERYNKKLI